MSFSCDDLDVLTATVVVAWTLAADRNWSVPAETLDWSCTGTADHAVDTVLAPAFFLASRKQDGYPAFEPCTLGRAPSVRELVEGLQTATRILTAVVSATEPETRAAIWQWPEPNTAPPGEVLLGPIIDDIEGQSVACWLWVARRTSRTLGCHCSSHNPIPA